jgi:exopolyphosphatase/guanosine-5'-triphosphate,3'-diphosphate pyrophosphatase
MLAAVDLGSNSFRLHIATHDGQGIRVLKTAREPIRLGAGLDSEGNLTQQAMQTALACLARFGEILQATPLRAVRVVATNTIRIARNSKKFLPLAEKAIGYPIEIISGEEEGRLIYMGVAVHLENETERRLVVDIGGGSTEVALGQGANIERVESFSIGTVRICSSFFGNDRISQESFDAAVLSARGQFEDGVAGFHPDYWQVAYGSSGTMRTLADVIEKNALGDGKLSAKSLRALRDRLIEFGRISRIELNGMRPERIPVVLGGLPILLGLFEELGIRSLEKVDAGLRLGVLWDLHMRDSHKDRRNQSIKEFMRRFGVDEARANKAAANSLALFTQLKYDNQQLDKLLDWSARLHEIGLAVSHTGFHKHGAYLVEHADLPGFTTTEQQIMSTLIMAHKGNLRKVADTLANLDFAKTVVAIRLGVIFMHAKLNPVTEKIVLKVKARIELEISKKTMAAHPTLSYWLSKEQSMWEEIGAQFNIRELS